MKYLLGGRRSGKTSRLLTWAREAPEERAIVTPYVQQLRSSPAAENVRAVSIRDTERLRGLRLHLGIDELSTVLWARFKLPVEVVTDTPSSWEFIGEHEVERVLADLVKQHGGDTVAVFLDKVLEAAP